MFELENNELIGQLKAMKTFKITNMPFITDEFLPTPDCHTCQNWINNKCKIQGSIVDTKSCYCGWYKDKNLKQVKVRRYLSLK